jgi:hypothetical protein
LEARDQIFEVSPTNPTNYIITICQNRDRAAPFSAAKRASLALHDTKFPHCEMIYEKEDDKKQEKWKGSKVKMRVSLDASAIRFIGRKDFSR